jgi:hypothetical protein
MIDKKEIQEANFNKLILLNLPPIQTRFIAYQLAEKNIFNFTTEVNDKYLNIYAEESNYKIEILEIDIPANMLEAI